MQYRVATGASLHAPTPPADARRPPRRAVGHPARAHRVLAVKTYRYTILAAVIGVVLLVGVLYFLLV